MKVVLTRQGPFFQTGSIRASVSSRNTVTLRSRIKHTNASAPLFHAIANNAAYTSSQRQFDINHRTVYSFYSEATPSWCAAEWLLIIDENGEALHPVVKPLPAASGLLPALSYTFVHFNPLEVVHLPTRLIGSTVWWRDQICGVEHDSCVESPGNPGRFWGARFDTNVKARRPIRVVEHYAKCRHRVDDGDDFALGKLARAVISSFPGTKRRRARSAGDQEEVEY